MHGTRQQVSAALKECLKGIEVECLMSPEKTSSENLYKKPKKTNWQRTTEMRVTILKYN